jgi:glycerophosphoryl diester phosphodiesterase
MGSAKRVGPRRAQPPSAVNVIIIALALTGLLLTVMAFCSMRAGAAPTPLDAGQRRIAGHRGATVGVDENTLSAFRHARPYADILETDVRVTKDLKMVIMHDATLDRTTNCTGKVTDRTLAYIKACTTPRGQHPPSLRQLLTWEAAQPGERELMLELKGSWSQTRVTGFVNEVTNYPQIRFITASSFNTANLDKVAVANDNLPSVKDPRAPSRAFIEGGDPTLAPFRVCDRYDGWHNSVSYLKKAYVHELQQVCNPPTVVAVYGGLNTPQEYQAAYDTGAWVMTVEDPKGARAWLNSK